MSGIWQKASEFLEFLNGYRCITSITNMAMVSPWYLLSVDWISLTNPCHENATPKPAPETAVHAGPTRSHSTHVLPETVVAVVACRRRTEEPRNRSCMSQHHRTPALPPRRQFWFARHRAQPHRNNAANPPHRARPLAAFASSVQGAA